ITGPVQVASHQTAGFDYFRIWSGGRLQLLNSQVFSNSQYANSGIQVDSNGAFATARPNGFYDGTLNGAVNSNGNMDFFLHSNSIVEYYGYGNQVLTGTGVGLATATHHRYGILNVNLNGGIGTYVNPVNDNVFVRTQLQLDNGEVNLNSYCINILNGQPSGIIRTNGYVKSELNASNNSSRIIWNNFQPGIHIFPFGKNASTYIPVSFKANNNFGTPVSISTRATSASDNLPLPSNTALNGVASSAPISAFCPHAVIEVVDRWWNINVTNTMEADITLSYDAASENTLTANPNTPLGISSWTSTGWNYPLGFGTGMTNGIGTISAFSVRDFNNLIITANNVLLPVQLLDFQARGINGKVKLDWATSTEINNDFFTVEKSRDGTEFQAVGEIDGAGNSSHLIRYTTEDATPFPGTSYYRLRQTDFDGKYSYSETRVVNIKSGTIRPVTVQEIGPNPFSDRFHLQISRSLAGTTQYRIYDLEGKMVYDRKEHSEAGNSFVEFNDLPILATGSYLLHVIADDQTEIKKLIKK
ncbi:MAG: T9SS type A sorting domain-containing protein, partial [Bacteroidota bacterium]